MSTATRVRSTKVRAGTNGRFRMTRNHQDLASQPRICTSSALHSPRIERSRTKDRSAQRLRWIASSQASPLNASSDRADLPLNLHPAAIRASCGFDPPPFVGPPEARVSGLFHGGGLAAPPAFCNEIGVLWPNSPQQGRGRQIGRASCRERVSSPV